MEPLVGHIIPRFTRIRVTDRQTHKIIAITFAVHTLIHKATISLTYNFPLINPRHACAARITVLAVSVCLFVCVCVLSLVLS